MKYLNVFVICVGLAIAGPVHNPRRYDSANKIESICRERGWSTVARVATEFVPPSDCDLKKRDCERNGKVAEELLTCLNVIDKRCNADSECGDGYICLRPVIFLGGSSACQPKKEEESQAKQNVTMDTQENTLTANVKKICENKEVKSQAA